MFLGEYFINFTGQGRIILPYKFREEIGKDKLILVKGIDGGVWGYLERTWEQFVERETQLPVTDAAGRDLKRFLYSVAQNVRLDRQGRFVIPENLRDFAGLNGRVVLIGVGDHFEIWNPEAWDEIMNRLKGRNYGR